MILLKIKENKNREKSYKAGTNVNLNFNRIFRFAVI
jgi:hypothetical protein